MIDKKRKIVRGIFGMLSLSSALFVFQACYGTPRDLETDFYIEGLVKAKSTDLPVPGIKVSVVNIPQFDLTDGAGQFRIYVSNPSEYSVRFEDIDADKNGSFQTLTSTVKIIDKSAYLSVALDDK